VPTTRSLTHPAAEAEKKKRGGAAPTGLAALYQQMLTQSDTAHQAAVAATLKPEPSAAAGPSAGPSPNLTIVKPPAPGAKSDLALAAEAGAAGHAVELNDDNQIVDKRELLSAGLNLSAPNTRALGRTGGTKPAGDSPAAVHRAAGTAASRREINARRAREVAGQLAEEEARVAEEQARAEAERTARTVAKRNQDGDIEGARARYLARKRQKLEGGEPSADGAAAA
jgi:coiled-coil domain-containing protein 55